LLHEEGLVETVQRYSQLKKYFSII